MFRRHFLSLPLAAPLAAQMKAAAPGAPRPRLFYTAAQARHIRARIRDRSRGPSPDQKVPYLAFRTKEPARAQKFLVALVPYADGESSRTKVGMLPLEPNALGIRVERQDVVTDVWFNLQSDGRRMHLNSNNTIAGWETDAYLLAFTRPASRLDDPAAARRFFVSCVSYLRRDGAVYLDSLSKVDAIWEPGKKATAQVKGQPLRKVRIREHE